MFSVQRLTIAQKLWIPTIALSVLIVVIFAATAVRTRISVATQQQLQSEQNTKIETALRWAGLTEANAARVVAGLLASDAGVAAALRPDVEATTARISELQKTLEALATTPDEKKALEVVAETRKAYIAARNEAAKLKADGNTDAALAALDAKVKPAVAAYLQAQGAFVQVQEARSAAMNEAYATARMRTVAVVSVVLFGMAGLMLVSTFFLVRSIRQPLRELVDHAGRIGQGDLSQALHTDRHDEIGDVQRALAEMQGSLRRVIGEVHSATDSIRTASTEIASGNTDLSARTEQAASNLQQAASSMEQLTGTVAHSADAAAQANQLASSAAQIARRGGEVVSQVVATMDDIHASSKKIADIIGVIDGIAFQTNILALNAAVEAARAGEQGRGFAVVAGEVRSLAQRSAEAAKEIKALIGTSVDKVETGSKLVGDAGATMNEIVASVQRVSDIIAEISAAAREQSSGIGQVNTAVNDLDRMTQQNAALVEQSAAAAESLKEQAKRLAEVVATFKLGGTTAATPTASTTAVTPTVAPKAPPVATMAAPKTPAFAAKAPTAQAALKPPAPVPKSPMPPEAARAPTPTPAAKPATVAADADDGDWQTF
jgi:methyl-accepting chemotaxis protein